jgi:hypothetical protein
MPLLAFAITPRLDSDTLMPPMASAFDAAERHYFVID